MFLETNAASDLLAQDIFAPAVHPAKHSPEFWEALIALGGTPEQVAPHLPELSEADVAAELAAARGRVAEDATALDAQPRAFSSRPNCMRSNFDTRVGERR